ncbi:GPALPP motifs-containing protein 1 [Aspergillus foveolatus]|uniref:GPALPP motifs-containing protein 1 n=1 Tax=Aspergillus foveolatus TaxID=210207 RepID=UPI003CCCCFF2
MDNPSKRKLDHPATTGNTTEDTDDASDKRRKVIGPSLPPPTSNTDNHSDNSNNSDSDSDDDDFGPSLPPPSGSVPQQPAPERSLSQHNISEEVESRPAPKRDAWMLAPPTGGSDRSRVDPTKLRNRKFQSGPRVGNAPAGRGGVDSSWTETPEEKIRRLQDEAMGIPTSSGPNVGGTGAGGDDKVAQAMREKVQRYNERVRGEDASSLVDEKKRKDKEKGKKDEDDPSKRAFDKEKDMALSTKLTNAQRRELMSKAADFGSRFSKGKFL